MGYSVGLNPRMDAIAHIKAEQDSIRKFTVHSPNGKLVEVQATHHTESDYGVSYDSRAEVWVTNPADVTSSELPLRAKDSVDYFEYGFVLIGNYWVNPNNPADVTKASKKAHEGGCIVV